MASGVNLAGYFDSTLGIGHVVRELRKALEAVGVPVDAVGLSAASGEALEPPSEGLVAPAQAGEPVNVVCVNPDGLEGAREHLGPAFFDGRPTVGVWWWEAGEVPARWLRAFDLVDEVWAGSRHVTDAVAAVSPVPVVRIPVPVTVDPAPAGRAELGVPEGFAFLTMFDYASVAERKHPLGAVEAFRRAFPDEGDDSRLVLKCVSPERDAEAHGRLLQAVEDDPRVTVLDRPLPGPEKDALIAACDCYLSLHRVEGFGLPLAEALLLGRPVIATAYSGPLDFLTPLNSYLVDYRLVPIGPGSDPYPAEGEWAEPDLDHAAALMREVRERPEEARRRAERGREDLQARHSPSAAGRALAARLERISGPRSGGYVDLDELERRIRSRPPEPAADAALGSIRRGLQAAVQRMFRAEAVRRRQVDEEVLAALRALTERLEALERRLRG